MTSASDRYQEKSDKKEHTMRNSSTPPLLRLEDICVKFGFVEALKSVNLSIQRQEVIAIVGDNGAGKSTLIKVIAGFLQPGFGHIYLNGEQVTIPSIREADRMGIASVFQGQEFCDNLDVASNLFLGSGLFNLFNLISGLCWLTLVALFIGKRRNGDPTPQPTGAA